MAVAHVISGIDPRAGGPVTALRGLARALRAVGERVEVVATHPAGADLRVAREMERAGVGVHLVGPVRGPMGWHRALRPTLERVIAEADVVHIHGLWEQIQYAAARCATRRGRPYIVRPCGMLDPWSLRQSRWKKRLYMRWRLRRNLDAAAALHFTSDLEAHSRDRLGLTPRAIVEPIGVALEEFEVLPEPGTFRRSQPAIGEAPLIVFMGRVHPGKGLEYLVPAMAAVEPREAKLAVVGPDSGGYMQRVRELAAEAGVSERVVFTGLLSGADRVAALTDADVFCLPSDHENFGVVVVEALATGTPVVVSDRVDLGALVAAHGVGEVVPTAVEPVAAALSRWLSDAARGERELAGKRGRELVWAHYDWRRIAARWREHYRQLATGEPVRV